MKYLLAALSFFVVACASEPKEAEAWKTKQLSDAATKIQGELNTTTGTKPCTFNYNYGLLEDIASPRASIYGTESTVSFIDSMGCSKILTLGPQADGKMSALGYGSDPAYMLKSGEGPGSAGEMAATLKKAIAGQKLPQPVIGLGMSMGGHNILKVASHSPEIFSKIVLLNPMILGPDQWKGEFELDFSKPLGEIDASYMPGNHYTKEGWIYENPEAELYRTTKLPPIFVTACKQDQFKLGPPTERWVIVAKERGFDVTFNYVDNCKHTEPDFTGVDAFLGRP